MIKIKDYQSLAFRTCADLSGSKLDMAHMILGMISEMNELEDAIINDDVINIGEELADQCWYIANYCNFRELSFVYVMELAESSLEIVPDQTLSALNYNYSRWSDVIKKYIAYDKKISVQAEMEYLIFAVAAILIFCRRYGLDFRKILDSNINKLFVRYPEKFNRVEALNRNLENERKTLEK